MRIAYLSIAITLFLAQCSSEHDHTHCNHHKHELTLGFAGDVMIGRLVNDHIKTTGYTQLWGNALALLRCTDINIVNLETAITRCQKIVPKVFNYKTDPDNVRALQEGHITVANLANNHVRDFDDAGLIETIQTLDHAHIGHVGAGKDLQAAQRPLIIRKHGITVGILGFTDNEPTWKAGENKPGINYIQIGDIETVAKCVNTIRSKVDFVIVTIHWGPNMRTQPSKEFISFAHQIIDVGVDIIHGNSAHVFQGIELYKGKLIMYDTGDFIDDYAIDPKLRNDQSLFFEVTLSKKGIKSIRLTPVIIDTMQVNVATDKNQKQILEHMQKLSSYFGTNIDDTGNVIVQNIEDQVT
jgi:poly-gamma-glutamate capsule biosynthesis protein CapA/YwtB (metallophosphatase superfamily)